MIYANIFLQQNKGISLLSALLMTESLLDRSDSQTKVMDSCISFSIFELFSDEKIIIDLKSIAHYAKDLIRYLAAENYNVCVLNPLSNSSMRKNNIRKTKTDKIDTYIIA